jgi:glycosyltransferase involved in cell wall biosynthesis
MKFLIHGNAPTVATGYGIQIAQLVDQLQQDGHEPACSSTYGIQGGVTSWPAPSGGSVRVYGCGYDTNSNDRVHMHAGHWFGGEPGWIIVVTDVWAIKNPLLAEFNTAAWVPIDHYTSVGPQPNVMEFFERTKAVPLAMSRFGENLLMRAGLDPVYIPLSVNTEQYHPTPVLSNGMTGRELMDVPEDAFVVGMVAMNKGWARDRKGFNEAFWAFSMFEREHPDAYLYVHADAPGGAEGIDLRALAVHSGIPPHKIIFAGGPNQYGYYLTYTPEMMAATYTAFDVLLAPSHGEGFCVPIIEAFACGTPVIATDFSAQSELVGEVDDQGRWHECGRGWFVAAQPEWDPAHLALYKVPLISSVIEKLDEAYEADRASMVGPCMDFAATYDTKHVYETYWKPFIAELEHGPDVLPLDREPMPEKNAVAVLCPIYKRTENIPELVRSFQTHTGLGEATLYLIADEGLVDLERDGLPGSRVEELARTRGESCAQGWNSGYEQTTEPWVLLIGDDVRFHDGWLDQVRKLSADYDVIGTNDTTNGVKNRKVANGSHSDHSFVRRSYVEKYGASLDGPGSLACEDYHHWYVDMELIKLAKARGVFTPCLDSIVEHLHPGYDGDEDARRADPTYMKAVEHQVEDAETFKERLPLIEMARTARGRL